MKKQLLSLVLLAGAWLAGGTAWAWDEPSQVNGVYQISTASELEWFSEYVNTNGCGQTDVVLTADLDFSGVTHTAIGKDAGNKFYGTFDGQGHHIKNLAMNLSGTSGSNAALFLWVRGGSTIKNLIIDKTCSFSAADRAAAFVCVIQTADAGAINIQNCSNFAPVSSGSKVAAGFVAACNWENTDQPRLNFTNCLNGGRISSSGDKTAVFFGWNKNNAKCTFTNCWNIAEVTTVDGIYNFVRGEAASRDFTFTNCYDFINTTAKGKTGTQGIVSAPAQDDDGYYKITSAVDLEWFSHKVDEGGDANIQIKGKLMNDIDLLNMENLHTPIGQVEQKKFNGTFDGQGYSIKNMIINRPNDNDIGFFGWLRGNAANTTVRNLIIDKSCTIHGYNRVGGITGCCQNSSDFIITLENIVNEATVIAEYQDAAGIIGGHSGGGPKWFIRNVVNKGTITAKNENPYAGALCCYLGGNGASVIQNFINLGTINGHKGGNIGRITGTKTNIIDLSDTNPEGTNEGETNYGFDSGLAKADIASGKLTFYINTQAGSTVFYQTIGTDEYPMPFSTGHSQVYQDYNCDGNLKDSYSNTVDGYHYAHVQKANGFCENCTLNPITSLSQDDDSYYLINNAAELEYFSGMVETGGQNTAHKAKLTADIDMTGVAHKPIGGGANDSNKFNSTFDGQNHTISHMTSFTRTDNVGLFSWVRGGSTIKNLIIDETCSVSGTNHVAAFVGKIQAGDNVRFENCISKAAVTASGNHAAAFVGKSFTTGLKANMVNCGNTGTITAYNNACALISWNTGGTIKNCWNTGLIVKSDWDRSNSNDDGMDCYTLNFYNYPSGASITVTNSFDASASVARSQGTLLDASAAASGELTYKIGGDWRQTIGSDAAPVLLNTHGIVNYISSAGYTTQYIPSTDVTIPTGVTAYAGVIKGDWLSLVEVDDAISQNDAVILKGSEGYYSFVPTTGASAAESNSLLGSDGTISGGDGIYALAKKDDVVGFYPVSSEVTIPAGKAYLNTPAGVKGFTFLFDDTEDAISSLTPAPSPGRGEIYNLAGQRISKMQKGINIVNGKKTLF